MTHIYTILQKYISNGCGSFDNPSPGRLYVQFKRLFHQTSCQVSFTEYRSSWDLECSGQGWSSPQNLGISCEAGRVLVAWENAAIAHTNDFVEFVLDYDGMQYEGSKDDDGDGDVMALLTGGGDVVALLRGDGEVMALLSGDGIGVKIVCDDREDCPDCQEKCPC